MIKNNDDYQKEMLLLAMQQAVSWLNFTTSCANYDLKKYGQWRCDYHSQAANFQRDYDNAGRQLEQLCVGNSDESPRN